MGIISKGKMAETFRSSLRMRKRESLMRCIQCNAVFQPESFTFVTSPFRKVVLHGVEHYLSIENSPAKDGPHNKVALN